MAYVVLLTALATVLPSVASGYYGARQVPVGIYNVNDAQGRPTEKEAAEARMYAIRFVLDTTTTLHRFFSGFNLEGVYSNDKNALAPELIRTKCKNKKVKGDPDGAGPEDCWDGDSGYESTPSPLPEGWVVGKGRIKYAHGNGGEIRASLVPVKADGTPDMANVIAKDTFNPVARYEKLIGEYGIPGKSGMLYSEFGGKTIHADTPYAVVYQNVDKDPRMNYVSYNSPVTNASVAGPNGQNTLDPNAANPVLGLDPREAVAWSTDSGATWGWGHAVGGSTSSGIGPHKWPDYVGSGDEDVKLPWYAWTAAEGAAAPRYSNQPYYGYVENGNFRLVVNDVPRAVTLTKAGGYAPIGSSVGVVTVKNLRTGQDGVTAALGSGLQTGALDEGIQLAVGDDYEITHSGTVTKAEGDAFQQKLQIVKDGQPYTTERCQPDAIPTCVGATPEYADRAELFATPFPFLPAPNPPTVSPDAASGVSTSGAVLNGSVNPQGPVAQYRFEYGMTTAYGSTVPVPDKDVGPGSSAIGVSSSVSGLLPGTTYHFRLVATNPGGTSVSGDQTFTTNSPAWAVNYGGTGEGPAQFDRPYGIAVDHEGNLWVTDYRNNHRVEKLSPSGQFLLMIGRKVNKTKAEEAGTSEAEQNLCTAASGDVCGKGTGFENPAGIAVDPQGDIWFADRYYSRIKHYSPEGEYLSQIASSGSGVGQFLKPAGIAFDEEGNLLIADESNDRIDKFTPSGEFLDEFGSEGSGKGQFNGPAGVTVDPAGNIWVADKGNHRVQKFDSKGESLGVFGSKGSGDGKFEYPGGIVADADGRIWVADTSHDRVEVLDNQGEYVAKFGKSGTGDGQFDQPKGLAFDPAGNIWVADSNNDRIQKWFLSIPSPSGWTLQSSPNPAGASSSALSGVSCVSTSSCLAVGTAQQASATAFGAGWSGSSWALHSMSSPAGATSASLAGVSCTASASCTAVGQYTNAEGMTVPLAQRWNGTAWSPQAPPLPSKPHLFESALAGVSCLSTTDCFAVGHLRTNPGLFVWPIEMLVERWDGTSWSVQPVPEVESSHTKLFGISCFSTTSCLAVGYTNFPARKPFYARWNGVQWYTVQQPPNPPGYAETLSGVSCMGAFSCLAVGHEEDGGTSKSLVMRYSGSWSIESVPSPPGATSTKLSGVSCPSTTLCVAVGGYKNAENAEFPLVEVWNGVTWTVQTPPSPGGATSSSFSSVSCVSAATCFATGSSGGTTLIERSF